MTIKVRVGTRGSALALAQTGLVSDELRAARPGIEIETVVIKTRGDRDQRHDVAEIGVGVFVKELENALQAEDIDIAVHSLKDMPSTLPPGFKIAAVPYREDPRDALVSRSGDGLMELPAGATVATGSARRKALILDKRRDLRVAPIRGNVPTRLEKLDAHDGPDAVVLAAAGLKRLGLAERISEYLACWDFVSSVGQGALALEVRDGDSATADLVAPLQHEATRVEVDAERTFLGAVEGGCSAPVSAHARVREDKISLWAFASSYDGQGMIRGERHGAVSDGNLLAAELAQELLERGAAGLVAGPATGVSGAGRT